MRNLFLGTMTFALAGLASPLVSPASAVEYPFCAMATVTCAEACDFTTIDQCRAYIAGGKGYCAPNPRYTSRANTIASTPLPRR